MVWLFSGSPDFRIGQYMEVLFRAFPAIIYIDLLAVEIPANRTKAQHSAAITEPPGA